MQTHIKIFMLPT